MSAPQLTQYALGGASVTADGLNTFEQTCDTFQQLRGLVGTSGMQVFARGQTHTGDQLGGVFYWNATSTLADNNLTVIQPTGGGSSGRWIKVIFSGGGSGPQGPTGPTGTAGSTGPTGPTGTTVYPGAGLAVSTGTTWGTSLSSTAPTFTTSVTSPSIVITSNSTTTTMQGSASATATTYTLPASAPGTNGYVLSSTTGGVLSWGELNSTQISHVPVSGITETVSAKLLRTIDVVEYGADPTGVADSTSAFQNAMNALAANQDNTTGGNELYIPPGSYNISSVQLASGVSMRGSGAGTRLNHTGTSPMWTMPSGRIIGVKYSGFSMFGNGATGEHGFYLNAQTGTLGDGGLWYSQIESVNIYGFGGKAFWLRGNASGNAPHQFNTFKDVQFIRTNTATSRCLSITGQCGQIFFVGSCDFDGPSGLPRTVQGSCNIVISREWSNGTLFGDFLDANTETTPTGNYSGFTTTSGWTASTGFQPAIINGNFTCQNSDYGMVCDYVQAIKIEGGWFEQNNKSVTCVNSADVTVMQSRFVNASGSIIAANVGWGVLNANSFVGYGRNDFSNSGTYNSVTNYTNATYYGSNPGAFTRIGVDYLNYGNLQSSSVISKAVTQQYVVDGSNTVTCYGNETMFINGSNTAPPLLKTFAVTGLNVGSFVTLIAFQGVLSLTTGGNIYTPSGTQINLRANDAVVLRLHDTASVWTVVGVAQAELTATSIPTTGYYFAGEFVRNTSAYAAGTQAFGWQRLTTGSANVAGTDWRVVNITAV